MKKSFLLLFLFLLLGCSNEGFESTKAVTAQREIWCYIGDGVCKKISENLCKEIGEPLGSADDERCNNSSSSGEEISSSSDNYIGSSSSKAGSSSSNAVSSSSSKVGSSSSEEEDDSSSSTDNDSSSSIGNKSSSSSSIGAVSSSSLVPPSLVLDTNVCSSFPSYVAKTKKEYIKNLVSLEGNTVGCGNITYTLGSSSSSLGDSISFAAYSAGSTQNLTITARVTCLGQVPPVLTESCPISVVVADKFATIETCHNPRVQIGPGTTTVEITCVNGEPPTTTPANTFGCDCPGPGEDWSESNIFTINGNKASGSGCWAIAPIPQADASKEIKRVLINSNKEIGCVAY